VDEHVLAALILLDEAEALVSVEELYLAFAGADNLGRHSASATTAGPARPSRAPAESAAVSAARKSVASAEAVASSKAVPTAELGRPAIAERIESLFAEPIPLVAPPAATTSIVTHLTNAPSFRPHLTPGCMDECTPNGLRRRSPRIIGEGL
jgi:hypothetical protein